MMDINMDKAWTEKIVPKEELHFPPGPVPGGDGRRASGLGNRAFLQ